MFEDEITRLEELAINMQVKYVDNDEVYNLAKALEQVCDEVADTELLEDQNFELQEEVNSLMQRIVLMDEFLRKRSLLEDYLNQGKEDEEDWNVKDLEVVLRAETRYAKSLELKAGNFTPR